MVEVNWVRLSAETLYYYHNQYLLKKKKVRDYFVYTIWENGELKFHTYNEYEFANIANRIINNLMG